MTYNEKERRKYARGKLPVKMFLHMPSGKLVSMFLSDISRGGVKVNVLEKLEVNGTIGVELCLEEHPEHIQARIAWVRASGKDKKTGSIIYSVGLDFNK